MKHVLTAIVAITCLCLSLCCWAENKAFNISVNGISNSEAKKNVTQTLDNISDAIKAPYTRSKIMRFYRSAPEKIYAAMQPFGYFKAKLNSSIQQQHGSWSITFNVKPGPVIKISKLDLAISGAGAHDPAFQKLIKKFPIKQGDDFNSEKYDLGKLMLFDHASRYGYFKASMRKSKIIINLKKYQASIIIHFYTGPRFRFGSTHFSKSALNPRFLHRYLTYRKNEPYNSHRIDKLQDDLSGSGYFNGVKVTPDIKAAKNLTIPVDVKLTERKRIQYTYGLGYGTDTGPRGSIGWNVRRVNQWGHKFRTLIQASKVNTNISASYIIPGYRPAYSYYTFTGAIGHLTLPTGDSRFKKLSANYNTVIGRIDQIVGLTYLDEDYNLDGFPKANARLLYPFISWQYVNKKNRIDADNGFSISLALSGTTKKFASQNSGFFQALLSTKFLFTLDHRYRFTIHAAAGHTEINNIGNLPLSLQFFAGGARSIRGFSYNSIDPGKNMFVGGIQAQYRIYKTIYLGPFYDFGNVANHNLFKNLYKGVGPVASWVTPVGVLQLSMAWAISLPKNPWRIQFSMGPAL